MGDGELQEGFHVTQNEKHWSNETETVNFIEQVIYPYVIDKRKELGLPADQKALLTRDVFRGQTTDHVAQILDSLNIKVPAARIKSQWVRKKKKL